MSAPSQAPTNGNVVKDLLSLDDDDDTTPGTAPAAAGNAFMDDLLGGLDSAPAAPSGQAAAAAAPLDLLSLLDDPAPAASTSGAPSQQPLVRPDMPFDPMTGLMLDLFA